MPGAPRDLVDADVEEIVQPVGVELLLPDTRDDPPDGLPVDAHQPADRAPIGLRGQPRHQVLKVPAEARTLTRERHTLDVHAVNRAGNPPQRRADLKTPHTKVQVTPGRLVALDVLAVGRRERAVRADQSPPAQRDPHDHPARLEGHPAHPHPLQAQQTTECSSDAHRPDLRLEGLEHLAAYVAARARRSGPLNSTKQPHPGEKQAAGHLRSPLEPQISPWPTSNPLSE